jgi:hypothetical protein
MSYRDLTKRRGCPSTSNKDGSSNRSKTDKAISNGQEVALPASVPPSDTVVDWVERTLSLKNATKVWRDLGKLIRSSGTSFVAARSSANGNYNKSAVPDIWLRTPEAVVSWMQQRFTRTEATEVHKALGEMIRAWRAIDCRPWMRSFDL